jgi:Cellulose binding domain/Chlorophyllase enzyme
MRGFLQAMMRDNLRKTLTIALILTLLAAAVIGIGRRDAHAATYCNVTYSVTNQWTGGFTVQSLAIQNTSSSDWANWTLTFTFPAAGQAVSNGWNGTFAQSGQNVTVTSMNYNGAVAANASANPLPGFNGTYTSSNPVPTSFSVNGNVCGASVSPTSTSTAPTATPTQGASPTPITTPTLTPTPGDGTCPTGSAPSTSYAIGHRSFTYYRGDRYLPTEVWYPRPGSGADTDNAPVADGTYPLILFSHGWYNTPFTYYPVEIKPLVQAGFIVAAPAYPNTKLGSSEDISDVPNQALDASYVITQVLALNTTSGDGLNGHIRAACIGADGHSAGGGTTHAMLTIHRDNRIIAASILAGFNQGSPVGPPVKVLHVHGTNDPTCSYSGAQAMYNAYPSSWPKAFLSVTNGGHDNYVWQNTSSTSGYTQSIATIIDWMRYSLYGDTAARNRLSADGTSSVTSFVSSNL